MSAVAMAAMGDPPPYRYWVGDPPPYFHPPYPYWPYVPQPYTTTTVTWPYTVSPPDEDEEERVPALRPEEV